MGVTPFDQLVARADRTAQAVLGGETVTYTPEAGPPVDVTGVFDAVFVLAKGTANSGVEATAPAVWVRLEDLPENPEDGEPTVTIYDAPNRAPELVGDYRVIERMPDGIGSVVLVLRKTD